eukprot:748730-Hanusia_phi.AAC.4
MIVDFARSRARVDHEGEQAEAGQVEEKKNRGGQVESQAGRQSGSGTSSRASRCRVRGWGMRQHGCALPQQGSPLKGEGWVGLLRKGGRSDLLVGRGYTFQTDRHTKD